MPEHTAPYLPILKLLVASMKVCRLKFSARVKQGDTLAITIALLPVVFPQMPVRFSAYITYDLDFHKDRHHSCSDTLRWDCLGWVSEKKPKCSATGVGSGDTPQQQKKIKIY